MIQIRLGPISSFSPYIITIINISEKFLTDVNLDVVLLACQDILDRRTWNYKVLTS